LPNVPSHLPRTVGATDAGEERASASGVTARRGYLDRSVGILSSRELCIAIGILADLNDLVRRLGSGEVLDRSFYEDLIQWFTVEFPSAGTDKFAIVKPAQRVDDFCSAVLASCGERDAVERAIRAKSSDGIGFGGIQEELREWRIECHSDLISSPNVRGQMPRSDGATDAGEERASASGVTARRGYLDRSVRLILMLLSLRGSTRSRMRRVVPESGKTTKEHAERTRGDWG